MKKNLTAIVFLTALGLLTACGGSAAPAATAAPAETTQAPAPETTAAETTAAETTVEETTGEAAPAEEEEEENYDTGDASLDDPRNGDDIGEKELLVVSFGTSFNDSRRETIGAIEEALQEAFPDWSVRRAFTSQIIIDHVEKRDGEVIDNVGQALDRAVKNGVKIWRTRSHSTPTALRRS